MNSDVFKVYEILSESLKTQTCRAELITNSKACILRQLKPVNMGYNAVPTLEEEYSHWIKLKHEGLLNVMAAHLKSADAWIALEDPGFEQLSRYYLKGCLRPLEAVRIVIHLLELMMFLHERGLIMQTLNPSDILFDRATGKVKLICLENRLPISEDYYEESNLHLFNDLLLYMDPAIIIQPNTPADVRSDLYSIGVMLYEMVLFRSLFGYSTYKEIISAHLIEHPYYSPEELQKLPMPLISFINKLLAKKPRQRFGSAAEALKELHKLAKLKVLIEN